MTTLSITNNTCDSNRNTGIYFWFSCFLTIVNNTCDNNRLNGIFLDSSDDNSIIWNTLRDNEQYGLLIDTNSDNNNIHHNSFVANGAPCVHHQAVDSGTNNQWYDELTKEGNSWSDYSDTGSYLIAGLAETSDLYPSKTSETDTRCSSSPAFTFIITFIAIGLFLSVRRHNKSV